jgi:hypothetical protein
VLEQFLDLKEQPIKGPSANVYCTLARQKQKSKKVIPSATLPSEKAWKLF